VPITLTKGLDQKCYDCGIALNQLEIAYEIRGEFVDYIERKTGTINITLCSGCRERIIEYLKKDQGDAILKRKELERDNPRMPAVDYAEAEKEFIDNNPFGVKYPDDAGVGM